jgi:hypothetical protein
MKQEQSGQSAAEARLKEARTNPNRITATPHVWRDPKRIRPRDFLYGDCIIRGYVSGIISMGGVGKTSEIQVEIAALVTGRGLLGIKPKRPYRVWYINLEDPQEEIDRRFAAIFKHYGISEEDLGGRLFTDSGRAKNFVVAHEDRGGIKFDKQIIIDIANGVRENAIDFLVVDPFVNCARFAENDNNMMAAIIEKVWAGIAEQQNCAGMLVHHVRKGGSRNSYTVEDARGAGALINSCRNVRVLNTMTKDEGKKAGVERHRSYFRIDNGKANLAPPSEDSEWRKIVSVDLDNAIGDCPADHIGVVTGWLWPDPLANLTDDDLLAAQKAVSENGPWRKDVQAKNWVGKAIAQALNLDLDAETDRATVKGALKRWTDDKRFREVEREDEGRRKRSFVEVGAWVNDGKPTQEPSKSKSKPKPAAKPAAKPATKTTTKSDDLPYTGPPVDVPNLGPDPLDQHGAQIGPKKQESRKRAIMGVEPLNPCIHCGKHDGVVYHVQYRLDRPSANLHEACITAWLDTQDGLDEHGKPQAAKSAAPPLTPGHARELHNRSLDWIAAQEANGLEVSTAGLEAELRTVLREELAQDEVEAAIAQVMELVFAV